MVYFAKCPKREGDPNPTLGSLPILPPGDPATVGLLDMGPPAPRPRPSLFCRSGGGFAPPPLPLPPRRDVDDMSRIDIDAISIAIYGVLSEICCVILAGYWTSSHAVKHLEHGAPELLGILLGENQLKKSYKGI